MAVAWVTRGGGEATEARKRRRRSSRASERRDARILCRVCRTAVSDPRSVFAMTPTGASGVFVNPHGVVHEIITVRQARNLDRSGPATTEFSWFAGYAWEIAWCIRCGAHLGWEFSAVGATDPPRFWGLRREAILVEDQD